MSSFVPKISKQVSQYFKYATSKNPSRILDAKFDPTAGFTIYRIYQNCVSCNVYRHSAKEMKDHDSFNLSITTHHCDRCYDKMIKILMGYKKDSSQRKEFEKTLSVYYTENNFKYKL